LAPSPGGAAGCVCRDCRVLSSCSAAPPGLTAPGEGLPDPAGSGQDRTALRACTRHPDASRRRHPSQGLPPGLRCTVSRYVPAVTVTRVDRHGRRHPLVLRPAYWTKTWLPPVYACRPLGTATCLGPAQTVKPEVLPRSRLRQDPPVAPDASPLTPERSTANEKEPPPGGSFHQREPGTVTCVRNAEQVTVGLLKKSSRTGRSSPKGSDSRAQGIALGFLSNHEPFGLQHGDAASSSTAPLSPSGFRRCSLYPVAVPYTPSPTP